MWLLTAAQAAADRLNISVGFLQRMSDARLQSAEACGGADGTWEDGTCWLGSGWRAAAAAGLAAAADFNARAGAYVPLFASAAMQACGVQLEVTVLDSGSTASSTLDRLTHAVQDAAVHCSHRRFLCCFHKAWETRPLLDTYGWYGVAEASP